MIGIIIAVTDYEAKRSDRKESATEASLREGGTFVSLFPL